MFSMAFELMSTRYKRQNETNILGDTKRQKAKRESPKRKK